MTDRWPRVLPLTGVLFVILAVLAFVVSGETPGTDDSAQTILSFYQDNDSSQLWAGALLAWGAVAFLFFLGVLRAVLHAAEGEIARFSAIAFGGGLIAAVGMLSFAGFTFVLGDTADNLAPEAAQALNALNTDFFFPVAIGTGTLMIATGIGSLRSRALPPLLSWAALVIGIVAITPLGFFAFLVFLIWTLVVSVMLWRRSPTLGTPAAVGP